MSKSFSIIFKFIFFNRPEFVSEGFYNLVTEGHNGDAMVVAKDTNFIIFPDISFPLLIFLAAGSKVSIKSLEIKLKILISDFRVEGIQTQTANLICSFYPHWPSLHSVVFAFNDFLEDSELC